MDTQPSRESPIPTPPQTATPPMVGSILGKRTLKRYIGPGPFGQEILGSQLPGTVGRGTSGEGQRIKQNEVQLRTTLYLSFVTLGNFLNSFLFHFPHLKSDNDYY